MLIGFRLFLVALSLLYEVSALLLAPVAFSSAWAWYLLDTKHSGDRLLHKALLLLALRIDSGACLLGLLAAAHGEVCADECGAESCYGQLRLD